MPRDVTVYANATKAAMAEKGVSMREIAREFGCGSVATVFRWFSGIDRNPDFEAYCLERFNVDWNDPTALCGEANPPVITGKDKGKWSEWLPIIDEARGPRPIGMGSNQWLEIVAAKHGKSARQLYRKVKELDGMRMRDAAIEIAAAAKAPAQLFALTSTSFDGEALKWAFRQWLDEPHFWDDARALRGDLQRSGAPRLAHRCLHHLLPRLRFARTLL